MKRWFFHKHQTRAAGLLPNKILHPTTGKFILAKKNQDFGKPNVLQTALKPASHCLFPRLQNQVF
jgi:hypothetical protein